MRAVYRLAIAVAGLSIAVAGLAVEPTHHDAATPDDVPARLQAAADGDALAWSRLLHLCDRIGHRVTGSEALETATAWAERVFMEDGHEAVHREHVDVPLWVRGEERLTMLAPKRQELEILGLGGSVGTTEAGIEAQVTVIHDFSELGPQVAGTVVLYDVPMDPSTPGRGYGSVVRYRTRGASAAAAHGAVAVLVRSLATGSLATPHTGVMHYEDDTPRIPAAAITTEAAAEMSRLAAAGQPVRVHLLMRDEDRGTAPGANVVAEIRGSEHPEEVVVIGAHLDSWDVGQGAQDDGVGVIEVMEALRLIRAEGVAPARTIRAVLYTSEEWGGQGGRAYAAAHAGEHHVAAVESDSGDGAPLRWGGSGTRDQLGWLVQAAAPTGLPVSLGGGGTDIGPLRDSGTLLVGLRPDTSHYFDIHHSRADTVDKVDADTLRASVGALAVLAWQLAELPGPAVPTAS